MKKAPKPFEDWVYYDPTSVTGLRWLPNQKWRKAHESAGTVNPRTGYASLIIKENGKDVQYMCHKIVYYLNKNKWPEDNRINHKNRVRNDNRIENLEYIRGDSFRVQSIQKIDRENKGDLPRYVSWNTRDKRYQGSVRKDGIRKTLGYAKCINILHKKAIDFVNEEYERKFEYDFVRSCNFCLSCPHLKTDCLHELDRDSSKPN